MAQVSNQQLKVIALISGGKDSMFAMLHCIHQNYKIIALANLYPLECASDFADATDLNSYMYQTAGHRLIPHYSALLDLPLYRRAISGSAIDKSLDYVPPLLGLVDEQADETEDLTRLLQDVKATHPDANAVCSGAILSTYQRTRVESVCARLGLVSLAPLWQYPSLPTPAPSAGGLLNDMASVGLEARVVKVASAGLDFKSLWTDVTKGLGRRMVEKAAARFGGSVLGEGGEFETVVVAGPRGVWKGRLLVEKHERIVMIGQAGEAWLNCLEGSVVLDEEKSNMATEQSWRSAMPVPSLWDQKFREMYDREAKTTADQFDRIEEQEKPQETWHARPYVSSSKSMLSISNLAAPSNGNSIDWQMASICDELIRRLATYHRSPDDILFSTILLRAMADFAQANAVYGKLFALPNPPARVSVACGSSLPPNVDVMLSCLVDRGHRKIRRGLHVQSRSFWAPANIGPYSQAISQGTDQPQASLVFLAGQIPLVPISMDVLCLGRQPESTVMELAGFRAQALLSLQHLWRVGTEMNVTWWTGAIAYFVAEADACETAIVAGNVWQEVHRSSSHDDAQPEEHDELDAWDRQHGGQQAYFSDSKVTRPLPDRSSVFSENLASPVPAFFAVQVSELPRGCQVEWQSLGYVSSKIKVESCLVAEMHGQTCSALDLGAVVSLEIPWENMASRSYSRAFSKLVFREDETSQADDRGHATLYTSQPAIFEAFQGQIVPCKNVWNISGIKLLAGLVVRREDVEGFNTELQKILC